MVMLMEAFHLPMWLKLPLFLGSTAMCYWHYDRGSFNIWWNVFCDRSHSHGIGSKLFDRFEIWQASLQQCCRDACQISERLDKNSSWRLCKISDKTFYVILKWSSDVLNLVLSRISTAGSLPLSSLLNMNYLWLENSVVIVKNDMWCMK